MALSKWFNRRGKKSPQQLGRKLMAEVRKWPDKCDIKKCLSLIEQGAEINRKHWDGGYTTLMYAAGKGHTPVVAALLEKGADIDARDNRGDTALNAAAAQGRTEVVRLIEAAQERRRDQKQDGRPPAPATKPGFSL